MDDESDNLCPLCMEEMDFTDRLFQPCKCGYQTCLWCWHQIMELAAKNDSEGRCPACRTPYDKEQIPAAAPEVDELTEVNADRRQKGSANKKARILESRKHLSNVRVVQRNLVYVIGLPMAFADETLLERRDYFGQYGKVMKIAVSRSTAYNAPHSANGPTASVYVTYFRDEDAVKCIQAIDGCMLEGKVLRACFGTTKYCNAWLKNMACNNTDCLYLHEVGMEADSFTKEEMLAKIGSKQQSFHDITHQVPSKKGSPFPGFSPLDLSSTSNSSVVDQPSAAPGPSPSEAAQPSCATPATPASAPAITGAVKSTGLPPATSWASKTPVKLSRHAQNGHPTNAAEPPGPTHLTAAKEALMPPSEPWSAAKTQGLLSDPVESGTSATKQNGALFSQSYPRAPVPVLSTRAAQASSHSPPLHATTGDGAATSAKPSAGDPASRHATAAAAAQRLQPKPKAALRQVIVGQGLPPGMASQPSSSMPSVLPAGTTWASGNSAPSGSGAWGPAAPLPSNGRVLDGVFGQSDGKGSSISSSQPVGSRPSLSRPNSFAAVAGASLAAKAASSWSDRLPDGAATHMADGRDQWRAGTVPGSFLEGPTASGAVHGAVPGASGASARPQGGSYAAVALGTAATGKGTPTWKGSSRSAASSPSRTGRARPSTAPGYLDGAEVQRPVGAGFSPHDLTEGVLGPVPVATEVASKVDGGAAAEVSNTLPGIPNFDQRLQSKSSHSDLVQGLQQACDSGLSSQLQERGRYGGKEDKEAAKSRDGSIRAMAGWESEAAAAAAAAGHELAAAPAVATATAPAAATATPTSAPTVAAEEAAQLAESPAAVSASAAGVLEQGSFISEEGQGSAAHGMQLSPGSDIPAGLDSGAREDARFISSILDDELFGAARLPENIMAHVFSGLAEAHCEDGGGTRGAGFLGPPARHSRSRFHFARDADELESESDKAPPEARGKGEGSVPGGDSRQQGLLELDATERMVAGTGGSNEIHADTLGGAAPNGVQPRGDVYRQQIGTVDGHGTGDEVGSPPGAVSRGQVPAAGLAVPPGFAVPVQGQNPRPKAVKPATSIPPGFGPQANGFSCHKGEAPVSNPLGSGASHLAAEAAGAGSQTAAPFVTPASNGSAAAPAASKATAKGVLPPAPVRLADIYHGGPGTFSQLDSSAGGDVEFIDPAIMAVGLPSFPSRARVSEGVSGPSVLSSLDSLFEAITLEAIAGQTSPATQAASGSCQDGGRGDGGVRAFPVTLQAAQQSFPDGGFQLNNRPVASIKAVGATALEPLGSQQGERGSGETSYGLYTAALPGMSGDVSLLGANGLVQPFAFTSWIPARLEQRLGPPYIEDQRGDFSRGPGGLGVDLSGADPILHTVDSSLWSFSASSEQLLPFARGRLLQGGADSCRVPGAAPVSTSRPRLDSYLHFH